MDKESDEESDFEEYYISFKIKRCNTFFSNNIQENLIRCEECFLISYLKKIKLENNLIIIYSNCRNNHQKKYLLNDYLNKFKENRIENFLCKYDNNKFNEDFIYCFDCKLFFCQNCQKFHDINENFKHHLIRAKYMDFCCVEHIKPFTIFCLTCEKNLCLDCKGHNEHKIINFKDYKYDNINEYLIKYDYNEIQLQRIENFLNKKSINILNYFNIYKSKIFYLNDLLKNIIKTYQFENNNNNMNFELLYNIIFVIINNKILEYNPEKLDLIKSKDNIDIYLNDYPLILNNQKNSKDYLFNNQEPSSSNDFYKIISIGAEKMKSKFCFSSFSKLNYKKNYLIYNNMKHFLNIYSIEKRKNIRILKNKDEDLCENVKSIKVFDDVNNEKIVLFSTNQNNINKLKIYELTKYSFQNVFIFENPLNDFCFYNFKNESFIALNVQGKNTIEIFYKDGRKFKNLNFIENVICMECYEDLGLKPKIYLLVTGNKFLKSFDINNYKLYKNYNIDDKDSYTFSKFYKTKNKFHILTSLENGDLKLIDFHNPNSYEIFNPDKNKFPIICFNFLNGNYLFTATEDKKIKFYDLKDKKLLNTYQYNNNIISLEIIPNLENSYLYAYDEEGNIFEYSINQI